jgi:putative tricarboxylic transport membrane protein
VTDRPSSRGDAHIAPPTAAMTQPAGRRRSNYRDAIAGAVTAIGGLVLFVAAQGIERTPGDKEVIGPAAFPTVLSAILIGAGLVLCLNGFRNKHDEGIAAEILQDDDSRDVNELLDTQEEPVPWRRLLLMIAAFAAYCVAMIPVGFLISTTAYLALVTCLVDVSKWKRNLMFAVGFSVIVYFTFTRLLAVELPAGVLG